VLISIVLTLTSPTGATLPAHLGRANHAATLARIGQVDTPLMQQIHNGTGPKPLTCSDLLGGEGQGGNRRVEAGQTYAVRITGLTQDVSQALAAALLADVPHTWPLAGQPFVVTGACCDPAQDPRTGHTTYETLAAAQLLQGGQPDRRATLLFHSPTAFQSNAMHMPIPLPNLVFGSLVDRWNAFSPVILSPEVRRFGEERVAISNYRLQSIPVIQKSGAPLIGGVGRVTYTALDGDRYWLATLQMLADFAHYSGVGVKTTIGMGQVRRA